MNINLEDTEQYLKFKQNLTKKIIKEIQSKYNIIDKNTDCSCNQGDILKVDEIIKNLNGKDKRCVGIVQNNGIISQCSKNVCNPTINYCKLHYKKHRDEHTKTNFIETIKALKSQQFDISSKTKKFINDSFYYIDDCYIYTSEGIKVGIVNNNEYILTDDPFILNEI
jgi:hypothetical protein